MIAYTRAVLVVLNENVKHQHNGWFDYEGYPRCIQCALAEYFNRSWNMDDVEMNIDIIFTKIHP